MNCLITHPLFGSLWLDHCEYVWDDHCRYVVGYAWEEISGFNIPEPGGGEYFPMNFPYTCVRMVDWDSAPPLRIAV